MSAPYTPRVAAWLEAAVPGQEHEPCTYYLAALGGPCGDTPTRAYISGRRCITHAPDQQNKEN